MVSDKALYAVAVFVLALGLGSSVTIPSADWAQRLDERSQDLAMRVLDRTQRYVARSDQFLGRGDARLARAQAAIVRAQVRLVTAEKVNQTVIRCSNDETEEVDTPDDPQD